ncbi:MAG: ATP-binding protein [Chloroflexota bacterium]
MANLILLILDMWMLSSLVLLLHYLTPRFGFAPLILVIGALTVLLAGQKNIYIQPTPGLIMFVDSNVLVPVVLLSVLVLYVANGSIPARMTIIGILCLDVMALIVLVIYRAHLSLPGSGSTTGLAAQMLVPPLNPRVTLGSLIAFAADMLAIAVVYQGIKNVLPRLPEWLVVGMGLLGGLWTDAVVFQMVSYIGTRNFLIFLPGDVAGKTLSAFILWPVAAIYLDYIAPRMKDYVGPLGRPTFDVLFGAFDEIKLALVRTEKALEHSEIERREYEAKFYEIAENISEALWLSAPNSSPFFVNRAYEVIWGRSAASIYANPSSFRESLHPEDRERVLDGMHMKQFGNYDVEFRIIRPDGEMRWVRDRAFPILNEAGNVYRIAGITEDITERKAMERDRLELAVEREKVHFMRDFISEFSHDLKTPLTAINLKVYQLARTEDPVKRRTHVDELEQHTRRMSEMIDNLLTLARLENMGDMALARVDINQMIREICDGLRPQIEEKHLQLVLELSPESPPVEGMADDLSRAFANLIDNAVHYTPSGGVVRVQTQVKGQEAIVQVSDTGIGIPKEDQARIFERFFRASNARNTDPGGTGLGLAIVKKIVEQHHGHIEMDSAVGSGTTFSVSLPVNSSFSAS